MRKQFLKQISPRLLTVREAAEYIGRTETAVRELVWNGKLAHIRTDRRVMLDIRDLDSWIDTNRVAEETRFDDDIL
jgi:excisionase family DNA binding protein